MRLGEIKLKHKNTPLLMSFQKRGVKKIIMKNGRVIVADEVGLGKTLQSIQYLEETNNYPVLIICPANLKINWQLEFKKWLNKDSKILYGSKDKIGKNKIVIVNYDIVKNYHEKLIKRNFKTVIIDEIHFIKSEDSLRYKFTKKIVKRIPHIIGLTGTPIENRPMEIYNALNILEPKTFFNRAAFGRMYCGAKLTPWGWTYSGASNLEELREKIQHLVIRRLKKNVMKDLPEKMNTNIYVDLTEKEKKVYNKIQDVFIVNVRGKKRIINYFSAYNELTLGVWELKRKSVMDWITSHCIECEKKLVVFAHHKIIISELEKKFKNICVTMSGSTKKKEKDVAVQRFQNEDKIKLFIGQNVSAGAGITLTASSYMVILELPQTPALLIQMTGRINRIGQKNAMNFYYFFVKDSVEEILLEKLVKKEHIANAVVDGDFDNSESAFEELLEDLKEK